MSPDQLINMKAVCAAIVFSLIGIVVLALAFVVFDMITPGKLWKQLVDDKNLPLAVMAGAIALALAQIIAAAIHG